MAQPRCRLRVPIRCCGPVRLPSIEARIALEGNLDTGQPFSYCYELPTQHRLESVATRTPPPICTSAQSPQTALVLRTVERREQLTVHDGWRLTITESHGDGDSSEVLQHCTCVLRNQFVESSCRFLRVTILAALAKIIRKIFTAAVIYIWGRRVDPADDEQGPKATSRCTHV